ncbi:MAG: hypothetical protein ACOYL5_00835 [Phototrophicaceae bacterium]|jgi:hypothetical protein
MPPIPVRWDDETTKIAVYMELPTVFTTDEFLAAQDRTMDFANSQPHRVHLIIHTAPTLQLPRGSLTLLTTAEKRAQDKMQDAGGAVVLVSQNAIAHGIINLARKATGIDRWQIVSTLEEARVVIAQLHAEYLKTRPQFPFTDDSKLNKG